MLALPLKLNKNILLIVAVAFTIFIGGTFMLHTVPLTAKNKIANGLLADFTITFPVLYYFILVRPFKIPAKSLLLVISLCCVIAYLVLPEQQRGYILQIRKLTSLAELFFIIYAATKFNKIRKAYKIHQLHFADPVYNLRSAMADVLGDSLPIKIMASELAMLRYGLLFWKKEKPQLKESISFSTYKESGYIAIWCILSVAVMVEVVAFHLLLTKWNNTAAIVVTILSLYGVIFLVADLSAIMKRNLIVTGDQLILRTGLRWRVCTCVSNVSSMRKITNDYHSNNIYFKGAVLKSSNNLLITFKNPVLVDKLYGSSKEFGSILMTIDDYESLADILNQVNK
jgi:hypothetical protein